MNQASRQRNRRNRKLARKRRTDPIQSRRRKLRMRRTRNRKASWGCGRSFPAPARRWLPARSTSGRNPWTIS